MNFSVLLIELFSINFLNYKKTLMLRAKRFLK